jgi:protein O-mannosyl-transferase
MQQKIADKKRNVTEKADKTPLSNWKLFCLAAGIALVALFSFSPAMKNSFVNQDDGVYVFENNNLAKPLPQVIGYFFAPHYFSGNYIPLTMISYAVIYHMADTNPELYHTVNVFIHLLNVLLVFWFVYLLSGRKPVVAVIVSLFFGIHPMHVESVAWVAELKDVLFTFLFLSGLIAYHKYIEWNGAGRNTIFAANLPANDQKPGGPKGFFLLCSVFVFFVLSVLSKPAAVVFPIVLLLLDFYNGRKFDKRVWLEKLPFVAVSFIFGIVAIKAQQADELLNNYYPFSQRLFFASYALLGYLVKFFLPVNLCNFYPYPPVVNGHLPYLYYVSPVIVLVLFYGIYRSIKFSRLVAFGFLFFFVNILPVLQLVAVGNALMADRYTYVPYIGLIFIIAIGFDRLYYSTDKKLGFYKPIAMVFIIISATACSALTYARCQVWENEDTIAADMVEKFPDDGIALNNKGYLLLMKGNPGASTSLLLKAIQVKPDYVNAYINLVNSYLAVNDLDNAIRITDTALNRFPQDYKVLNKKGYILYRQGNLTEALRFYKAALHHNKNYSATYINMALCYYSLKDYDNWMETLDVALQYEPDNYALLNDKGYALFLKGNYNAALTYYKASLEKRPGYDVAMANLYNCRHIMDSLGMKN